MIGPFSTPLAAVARQRGVLGALVVSESDGIVIDSFVQQGVAAPVIAALAALLYRRARLSAESAGIGAVAFVQLEAERGRLCAVGIDDLVLVALTDKRANLGLLRGEMLKAVETLA